MVMHNDAHALSQKRHSNRGEEGDANHGHASDLKLRDHRSHGEEQEGFDGMGSA